MTRNPVSLLHKAWLSFSRLSLRERRMIYLAAVGAAAVAIYLGGAAVQDHIRENRRILTVRTEQLKDIHRLVNRYKALAARLERVQRTFAQSQMTYSEVASQLDQIVKETIGSNTYDLKKGGSPSQIGFEYERQAFTLNVRSLSLEQVTRLLYQLEQGNRPLFLGKVDLIHSTSDGRFSATLEVFSIQKRS